jgi:hypothetical protein
MPEAGFISASMAKDVMTNGRGKDNPFGATFMTRAHHVGAGRVGYDTSTDISHLASVEWGNEQQWVATEAYQDATMATVHSVEKWHQLEDRFGCTVDGLVGEDGMIEIKCPNSINHLRNVLYNEQLDDYIHQIQFSLWITGRQWCDFISFDSRAPIGLQLHVHRVERDEVAIAELKERAGAMDIEADRIAELLRTKMETK